ncbi:MAG: DNA (cytosine-5-)-methyltransferase [Bacteroidaceae bacterium]
MNVLSLFDGMSCGQIALKELGIIPQVYYASEIDKHAIKQTQLNFPNTVQIGDVTKWRDWDIDWSSIDLMLAGSPCQGFSLAGKQLAFDDPRSKLFFVFIDILNHCKLSNPNAKFILENVNMKREYMRIISEYCGVFPVNINSNLVSAQNRNRWYWTNIRTKQVGLFKEVYSDIPQPKDRGITLRDILESEVDEKYYATSKCLEYITKEFRLKRGYTQIDSKNKSLCLMARSYTNLTGDYVCVAMRGREDGLQHFEPQHTGKTNCLTSVQKDNMILKHDYDKGNRIRRLTPTECSRLQTIPAWYKWGCSDSAIYKMLGNGWTVEVIKHILSYLKY